MCMTKRIALCGMLLCSLSIYGSAGKDKEALRLTLQSMRVNVDEPGKSLYSKAQDALRNTAKERNDYQQQAAEQKKLLGLSITALRIQNLKSRTALLAGKTALEAELQKLHAQHVAQIAQMQAEAGAMQGKNTELEAALVRLQADHVTAFKVLQNEHQAEILRIKSGTPAFDSLSTALRDLTAQQADRWREQDERRGSRLESTVAFRTKLGKHINALQDKLGNSEEGHEYANLFDLMRAVHRQTMNTHDALEGVSAAVNNAAQASAQRRAAVDQRRAANVDKNNGLRAFMTGASNTAAVVGFVATLLNGRK